MKHKIEITKDDGMILDGVNVTKELAEFTYFYKAAAPEGQQFAIVITRAVMDPDTGKPVTDDTGNCAYSSIFYNPDITVEHDGYPRKKIVGLN